MTIKDKIRDEKLQYTINREAAKISALLSRKIDKNEYLKSEEILPLNQRWVIEQAKFTYSPLGKALEKQTKTTEDQGGEKQIKALEEHRKKPLVEFNKLIKNDFIIAKDSIPLKEQKKYLMNLFIKDLLNLWIWIK